VRFKTTLSSSTSPPGLGAFRSSGSMAVQD
jgi:hypothetical protein